MTSTKVPIGTKVLVTGPPGTGSDGSHIGKLYRVTGTTNNCVRPEPNFGYWLQTSDGPRFFFEECIKELSFTGTIQNYTID